VAGGEERTESSVKQDDDKRGTIGQAAIGLEQEYKQLARAQAQKQQNSKQGQDTSRGGNERSSFGKAKASEWESE
jgi:hypothetical protein